MHMTHRRRTVLKQVRIAEFVADGFHPGKRRWIATCEGINRLWNLYSRSPYSTLYPCDWTTSGWYPAIVTHTVAVEGNEYQVSDNEEHWCVSALELCSRCTCWPFIAVINEIAIFIHYTASIVSYPSGRSIKISFHIYIVNRRGDKLYS